MNAEDTISHSGAFYLDMTGLRVRRQTVIFQAEHSQIIELLGVFLYCPHIWYSSQVHGQPFAVVFLLLYGILHL